MDIGDTTFDFGGKNLRWQVHAYFKYLDKELNNQTTFLAITLLILLALLSLTIFIIILVFLNKFKATPKPSPTCDFRIIESDHTLQSLCNENISYCKVDIEPEAEKFC